jgi:copper homeostasis protein
MINISDKYILEICCYSANDVVTAAEAGANRVELCNGYEVGGTTPSIGNLIMAKSLSTIPIYVMIRPRGGNFVYSSFEKKVMLKDIETAVMNKADGIVFGALKSDGSVDKAFCKEIINLCHKLPTTFHRAIDLCNDTYKAIDLLVNLGVQNILTSGAEIKAEQGMALIKKMNSFAQGKINIMAGSGINAANILLFANIGLTHFHSSASVIKKNGNQQNKIGFNASLKNNELSIVSKENVIAMKKQLNHFYA